MEGWFQKISSGNESSPRKEKKMKRVFPTLEKDRD